MYIHQKLKTIARNFIPVNTSAQISLFWLYYFLTCNWAICYADEIVQFPRFIWEASLPSAMCYWCTPPPPPPPIAKHLPTPLHKCCKGYISYMEGWTLSTHSGPPHTSRLMHYRDSSYAAIRPPIQRLATEKVTQATSLLHPWWGVATIDKCPDAPMKNSSSY